MIENSTKKTFYFRVYGPLNDFLPALLRQRVFALAYKTPIKIEEVLESIGIPRSEVALILVNSEPENHEYKIQENDYLSIYPVFESFDISAIAVNGQINIENPRFILDSHLGKLAKYLRMLGFDTLYENNYDDKYIIETGHSEKRIILTRDKLLLQSKDVLDGYYVRAVEKHEQLREVVRKFSLVNKFKSFTRCMTCNSELIPKGKNEIGHRVEQEILKVFNDYFYCSTCNKVFWKGSHFERMEKLILSLINE